jgi:hypothetical protein
MADHTAELRPTELRQRADACSVLASKSQTGERKAVWLARVDHWEELALKRVERLLESVKSKRIAEAKPTRQPR